jgi:hypothetical protein
MLSLIKTHKNIILHVVFCGCETWTLKLKEEHRMRVFESRVLGKLHNEFYNLYSYLNIRAIKSKRLIWAGHVACVGKEE